LSIDDSTRTAAARPDGIVAALLAVAIVGAAGWGVAREARARAERRWRAPSALDVPFKYQTLTLARAALDAGDGLPVFGSSELFCCGKPFRPTETFAGRPTGFRVLALGHAGTAHLSFVEALAALGPALRGRTLAISASPPWFRQPAGPAVAQYGSVFVAEHAYGFAFAAPIPRALRARGARRMLAYPDTVRDDPLLRVALEDVGSASPLRALEYRALEPLGWIALRALDLRDAVRTLWFLAAIERAPAAAPATPPAWTEMAALGTRVAERSDTTNPFGFADASWRELRRRPTSVNALALRASGRTNRDGTVLPPPLHWRAGITRSAEWRDMRLALQLARALGARPLVWTLPLPGAYLDYTRISAVARRRYYDRYARIAARAGVPSLDFRDHEEDPYFLADPGSHLSARGWVFADRALDLFWSGRSPDEIRTALATLAAAVAATEVARADEVP
jgi:D-alanine transfer protein